MAIIKSPTLIKDVEVTELPPINIYIGNITNLLPDFSDRDTQYTVREGVDCIATGTLCVPNQNFRVPFVRTDTNRKVYMLATVENEVFTLTLNFKTSGNWVTNSKLINSELSSELFTIENHCFKVI